MQGNMPLPANGLAVVNVKRKVALPHIKCVCLLSQFHLSLFTDPTQRAMIDSCTGVKTEALASASSKETVHVYTFYDTAPRSPLSAPASGGPPSGGGLPDHGLCR